MTRIATVAVLALGLGVLAMPAREANALGCLGGCFTQRLACVQSARAFLD